MDRDAEIREKVLRAAQALNDTMALAFRAGVQVKLSVSATQRSSGPGHSVVGVAFDHPLVPSDSMHGQQVGFVAGGGGGSVSGWPPSPGGSGGGAESVDTAAWRYVYPQSEGDTTTA